ncbi:Arm DNA-binding domain-containing protein [Dyadobacter sp. CY345]|uniref:Arm DNA-binding domain-containing protein n=1 Tax=Dyadobacter sp. CY345 TaxID=2909335 RepID=UPI0038D3D3D2
MPIYARISIDSQRAELATSRQCLPSHWESAIGRLSGNKEDARSINSYLSSMQEKVLNQHSDLYKRNERISAIILKIGFLAVLRNDLHFFYDKVGYLFHGFG